MPKLFEITLQTLVQEESCINRWTYVTAETAAVGNYSLALFDAFGTAISSGNFPDDTVMRALQLLMSNQVDFVDITVRDVFSNTDFVQSDFVGATGAVVADVLPAFNAFALNTNRVVYNIARGQKRITGVAENDQAAGFCTAPAYTRLTALAGAMSTELSGVVGGTTVLFQPCVVSKLKYRTNPDETERDPVYAYKYYPEATQFDHIASPVEWFGKQKISHQASRG